MTLMVIIGMALVLLFAIVLIGRRRANRNIVQYTAEEVKNGMKSRKIILLDVRTGSERAVGSIPKSLHIPLYELTKRTGELKTYRDAEIVCYCQSGNRSIAAADQLDKLGFRAASLKGGIVAWNRAKAYG